MNPPGTVPLVEPDFSEIFVSSTGYLRDGLDHFISTSGGDWKIVEFLNYLFPKACEDRASDIHMQHHTDGFRIRVRRSGELVDEYYLNSGASREINSKIRSRCKLEISDTESPLDGKFTVGVNGRRVDVRVSILPSDLGQTIVCRLLDPNNAARDLNQIWMRDTQRTALMNALDQDEGIILTVGPTGSGKTTTLYGGLNYLNKPGIHVITAEDPIEYSLPGATQVSVHPHFRPFAKILRAMLRQDFEVGLVGEIRDPETAQIAMTAANTGHLILSSLHTRRTLSTVTRLLDLEVKPYEIADALRLVVAQRLPKKICPHCSIEIEPTENHLSLFRTQAGSHPIDISRPFWRANAQGCEHCKNGYVGVIPVMEMLVGTPSLCEAIERNDREVMRQEANSQAQYVPLFQAALNMSTERLVDYHTVLRYSQ